ncbi:unnamed protein product [Linum tenue]|uniref:Uncharacterized protein n=1 Tax=Linum tenue TaxID=586396 RepID=A0AAV0LYZ5_9ROSI|nr:unnamed protein product [Linum tenue]
MSSPSSLPLHSAAAAAAAKPATTTTGAVAADRVSSLSFPSTVWADGFLDKVDLSHQAKQKDQKYEVLKEDVRKMVISEAKTSYGDDDAVIADKLRLIDAVQRLGVGHHFKTEIEEALGKVHDVGEDLFTDFDGKGTNLYCAALRFRLLRQQGFSVSQDGFSKLKNSERRFKEWLVTDEKGLLSLYEAAHIAFNGEDILDEAKINPSFRKQIDFALRVPAWKCDQRSLARHSIDNLSYEDSAQNQKLLTFAKFDFNVTQNFHQHELLELSEWWRNIDVKTNFPYVRDRLVECYYCINAIYFEPKYRLGRIIATKVWMTLAIIDDTYDNFATYEEVRVLTEAIQRMDVRALQELPDNMKKVYRAILNLFDEIEKEIGRARPTFSVEYAKEERLSQAYLVEVRWRDEGSVPTLKEYMTNRITSSGMSILSTAAFVGLGPEIATKEGFEWAASSECKMMKAGGVIGGLQNDIFSHKVRNYLRVYMTI